MQTGVAEVGFPRVVKGSSEELGQDVDGIESFRAAFAMDRVIGGVGCGGRMQPPEFALHP